MWNVGNSPPGSAGASAVTTTLVDAVPSCNVTLASTGIGERTLAISLAERGEYRRRNRDVIVVEGNIDGTETCLGYRSWRFGYNH